MFGTFFLLKNNRPTNRNKQHVWSHFHIKQSQTIETHMFGTVFLLKNSQTIGKQRMFWDHFPIKKNSKK